MLVPALTAILLQIFCSAALWQHHWRSAYRFSIFDWKMETVSENQQQLTRLVRIAFLVPFSADWPSSCLTFFIIFYSRSMENQRGSFWPNSTLFWDALLWTFSRNSKPCINLYLCVSFLLIGLRLIQFLFIFIKAYFVLKIPGKVVPFSLSSWLHNSYC